MRALLSLVLLLALTAWVEAGGSKPDSQEVVLRFSWWGSQNRHDATLRALDQFEQAYPGIKVEAEYSGSSGYLQKISSQLTGGTAPDLMQLETPWASQFTNQLLDLETMSDTIELDNFPKGFLDLHDRIDGTLYSLPTGANGLVLLFRRDLFDEYGLQISDPYNYDDLLQLGRQLATRSDGSKYVFHNGGEPMSIIFFEGLIRQRIGHALFGKDNRARFSHEDARFAVQMVRRLVEAGAWAPREVITYEDQTAFYKGQVFARFAWASTLSSFTNQIKGEWDVVGLPHLGDDNELGVMGPAQVLAIPRASKHTKEAALLLNFLLNDERAVAELKTVRSIPVSTAALATLTERNLIDPLVKKGMDIAYSQAREEGRSAPFQTVQYRDMAIRFFDEVVRLRDASHVDLDVLLDDFLTQLTKLANSLN